MAFDAIEIYFGELNMKAEDHIMKAVQQVDVNVDKEKLIEAIKSKDFVDELIGYIFAYPDDDYMTMECLCRKLHKYGLIDKKDGEWTTDFIERKDEPTSSKMEQVDKDINVRSKDCKTCKWGEWYRKGYDITMMDDECGGCCSWNSKWTPKDEPQTERNE